MSTHSAIGLATVFLLAASCLSAGAQATGGSELQAARDELRLRVETERRMRRDYEALLAGGRMSAAEVADFEEYLRDLGMLVDEQRRAVARLQGNGVQGTADNATPLPADFDRGQTDTEKLALLDAQLGSSLSEFDEKLLREQQELAEKSRAAANGKADGTSAASSDGASAESDRSQAGEGSGEAGKDPASSGAAGSGDSTQQGDSGEHPQGGGTHAEGDDQVASAGGHSDAGRRSGNTTVPADIPDGKDDDIVARQLREAAESEQDPELREKLWEEYRKYKNRTR